MNTVRHEILPPSGVEFAACLRLTPATTANASLQQYTPNGVGQTLGRSLFNVVVARSNLLRVFEVREEPAPISTQKEDEKERRASVRRGTEAVEGEVEMDVSGEGFVNMGSVKVNLRYPVPLVLRQVHLNEILVFTHPHSCDQRRCLENDD